MSTLITTTVQGIQNVKYDASTTAFTVGSDGTMTINQAPIQKMIAFKAIAGSGPALSNGAVPLPYSNVTDTTVGCHNIGGHFNTSTYKFSIPRTGIYHFGHQLLAGNMSDGEVLEIYIKIQDSDGSSNDELIAVGARQKYQPDETGHGGYMEGRCSTTGLFTAGKLVYFSAYRSGSTATLHTNSGWTFCFGYYMGSS